MPDAAGNGTGAEPEVHAVSVESFIALVKGHCSILV